MDSPLLSNILHSPVVHDTYCWKPLSDLSRVQWLKSPRMNFGESGEMCSSLFSEVVICSVAALALGWM